MHKRRVYHRLNRLLAALEEADFARLEPHLEIAELASGQVLYEPGERIRHAYFPHTSIVSLVAVLEDGGIAEMAVFGREGALGYASSIVTRRAFGRYVVQIPGSASRMDAELLQEVTRTCSGMRGAFLSYVEALLSQTFQSVACNAVHSVEARCCRWILATRDRVDGADLHLTHEFLAEMLGVQRSTVSLITRSLQGAGLITQRRGVITVTDSAGLQECACECYGTVRQTFERLLPGTYAEPSEASQRSR